MKCAEALDAMLECDPADLEAASEHPIALHLRDCPRCSAVASSLTRGLSLLVEPTAVLNGSRRRRTAARAVALTALPIAAGFALMVLGRGRPAETVSPVASDVSPMVANVAAPPAAPVAAPVAVVIATPEPVKTVADEPSDPTMFAQRTIEDTSIAFTPLDLPFSATDSTLPPSVRVTPVSGQRVAILKTSDPKVTVVWIY